MTSSGHRILVTGASGYVGRTLIRRLEQESGVEHILATDVRPLEGEYSTKVRFIRHDVTDPIHGLLQDHDINSVAHLAFVLKPGRDSATVRKVNIGGTANVLDASVKAGVEHILCFSSTTVYGAHADNPPLLTEDSPMRPVAGFQYGETKVAVELLLWDFVRRNKSPTVSILRSCPVMGPRTDNFISRVFSRPLLVGIKGSDPPMQLLHEDDMTEVLSRCLLERIPGTYNMAGRDSIRWSEMAEALGKKIVYVPPRLLYGITDLSWNMRLQNESPASGLDFIRYRWTVSTEKITRDLGVNFKYSSREALMSFANGAPAVAREVHGL
ncbi:MAG: NAD-dependent epimerase/dehydratase family protein [Chloroflexi bacterium]|nr:NAD-dependent epimerase/dehydratase family protein [Chloroflexota bacterium]